EMAAGLNSPKLLVLKGNVDARMTGGTGQAGPGDSRRLTTEELRIAFAEKGNAKGARLRDAETAALGRLELTDAATATTKNAQTVLQADQLSLKFDDGGAASRLDAKGNVQTERTVAGGNKETATANNGFVEMAANGGWSRMELEENVQLKEVERSARADHAVFQRTEQTVTLIGHATARDATSQTSAQKLMFWQATGEVRGEGDVRSSDLSAKNTAVRLAPAAANIRADTLIANSKSGRALYEGHARLWQGESVMEAEN